MPLPLARTQNGVDNNGKLLHKLTVSVILIPDQLAPHLNAKQELLLLK